MSTAPIFSHPQLSLSQTKVLLDIQEADQRRGYRNVTLAQDGYTADEVTFGDYTTNCRLAAQGIFSIDRKAHRAQRDAEAARQAELDRAYAIVGVDRQRAYGRILRLLEGQRTGGIWARSTAEYCNARDALDELILIRAAKALTVDLRVHDHGSVIVVELVSDEARGWVRDNVEVPGWAWIGRGISVEPRLVDAFVAHAEAEGLKVAA